MRIEANKTYKIYVSGNTHIYKIGQTSQHYVSDRIKVIRQTDKDIKLYAYVEFPGSKPLAEYIEATLRLHLYNKGYTIIGNDHIQKKNSIKVFKKTCLDIITETLNGLNVNYKVVVK